MNAPNAPAERFRSLYAATYAELLRFVTRRVPPAQAEDVVADVFLVVWRRVADLPAEVDDQRAWLFGIARHVLLNETRTRHRQDALAVRVADHLPEDHGVDPDLIARRLDLARAWPRLRAADQETIALTAWDGLTGSEAAAVLDISPVAYRLRLSRARAALRRHLDLAARADGPTLRSLP